MKRPGLLSKTISAVALTALLAAPLFAPPTAAAKGKKRQPVDVTKLLWPPPPAVARVRYVGAYSGEDVRGTRKQTFLERLAGVEDNTRKSMLVKPYGVAVDSKGRIYVTDTMLAAVFVFDLEAKTLDYRGEKAPAAFRKPTGITLDDQDRLFVSDSEAHNITAFSAAGDVISVFGTDELKRPAGMAVDSALKRLYVADVKARKVAVYDLTTLKFQRWFGKSPEEDLKPGDQDKILVSPSNLAVDADGLLYIVDTYMNRVAVFDTDGEFVRQIGTIGMGAGKFMRPRGIAIDRDGHVYVTDAMANLFQVLTADGKALMPVGNFGMNPGQFQVPAAIAIDRHNRIIVADQINRRIQVFRYVTDAEAAQEGAKRAKNVSSSPAAEAAKE